MEDLLGFLTSKMVFDSKLDVVQLSCRFLNFFLYFLNFGTLQLKNKEIYWKWFWQNWLLIFSLTRRYLLCISILHRFLLLPPNAVISFIFFIIFYFTNYNNILIVFDSQSWLLSLQTTLSITLFLSLFLNL